MGRRQSREAALQALYQLDVGGAESDQAMAYAIEIAGITADDSNFMKDLVLGSINHLQEIDQIISTLSKDWNIDRLARVDHNIMRMAIYEILYREDIPFGVTVNEAVELAKMFGGEDSGRFINGVLAHVGKKETEVTKPGD